MKVKVEIDFPLDLGELGGVDATVVGVVEAIDGRASAKVVSVLVSMPNWRIAGSFHPPLIEVKPLSHVIEEMELRLANLILFDRDREGA